MKQQILIVEDNELNREMLRELLADDYNILEAENGQVALDILEQDSECIDLILLDVMMPVMDGYAFLDKIKKDPALSMIPVIVMTQGDSEADEISALEHGANDFVPKPYRPKVMKHRVASLIKLHESAAMVKQFKTDRLTGLYTKEFFYRKVRACLDENPEKEYTILCCNIENFKLYNDTYGREAGDRLLVEAAEILRERVSRDAICCRYSADRFLSLTEKKSENAGRECFEKARRSNRSELQENIPVKLGIYEITDRSIAVEQMCDRALWVVDTIKGKYDQYVAVYDDALRSRLLREQAITDVMERALSEKQFIVYFQPKYSLRDDCMVGAEALVRWLHPKWGFMSPGEFIPMFERNGFIRRLDEYVWESVCEKLQEWKRKGYPLVPVSVNVSRADAYDAHLVEIFCGLIKKYGLAPDCLHLEITESAYTENPEQIIRTVEELRGRGFVIEMDDFGSGYSSLNMFSQMSMDTLKLDMGFIQSELSKSIERSILSDVINMAHRMHLNVVAEGVETGDQRHRLKILGCDYVQGYFFAKPMPDTEFEELLKRNQYTLSSRDMDACICENSVQMKDMCGAPEIILVVEDDEVSREMLAEILAEQYLVLTAKDGREGLDILRKSGCNISAVMLDIQMPVMNGYEFLEHVANDPMLCKIPVIVTTGQGSAKEEERCLALGATDFIGKPYNAKTILKRIENIVQLRACDNIISELKMDMLTGFKNRKAYYEDIAMIEQDPERSLQPVGVIFADINGLKMTNDQEGHEAGDRLVAEIARTIRGVFVDANIYRIGGDEFVILSFAENECDFNRQLKELEHCWKDGCSAALGSVWLEQAKDLEQHVAFADQVMYRNKSKYYEKRNHDCRRVRNFVTEGLLRKVDEVSEYLPGGFFIYHADAKEELISFNMELMRLYGCDTEAEFRELTGNSFRGMVHPDDLELVESNISSQIEKENDIDYVEYRIICKDGTVKLVRDYGRFVHTELYGDVYYVFVNDITRGEKRR